MGWMMGTDAKFKIERKEARTMVVVPADGPAGAAGSGWVWWPEKNDLVIAAPYPPVADAIIAALDGKAPSAVDHPLVQELKKPEGTFEPVSVAFVDTAGCPDIPAGADDLSEESLRISASIGSMSGRVSTPMRS